MSTFVQDGELSMSDLETVVRSGEEIAGVGKMRALSALQRRGGEGAIEILRRVAADKKEEASFRHLAIVGLYRLLGRDAREAFLKIAHSVEGEPAADIATLLGRIGEPGDRQAIDRLIERSPRHARKRARFALALLDYRSGEKNRALQLRNVKSTRKRVREWQKISSEPGNERDLLEAAAALEREPLDIEFNLKRARKISCPPSTFVWVPTAEAEDAPFFGRNCVVGLLLRRNEITCTYSMSLFGLATTKGKSAALTLHRIETGDVIYVGEITPKGSWDLRATAWPGLAPIQIKGRFEGADISFDEARSATSVEPALVPKAVKPDSVPRLARPNRPIDPTRENARRKRR